MQRLSRIFNSLNPFEQFFLEVYYRLKFKTSSKRFLLLNLLIKNEFVREQVDDLKLLQEKPYSFIQIKRRMRSDLENMVLLKIFKSNKFKPTSQSTCKLNFLLIRYYHENCLFDEASVLLKKTRKLIVKENLFNEQIEYYFLIKELYDLNENLDHNDLVKNSLDALKSIELQLLNDLETINYSMESSKDSVLTIMNERQLNYFSEYPNKKLIRIQRNKLIAWKRKDYLKTKKYLENQCYELNKIGAKGYNLKLECLLELMYVNIYNHFESHNIELIRKLESECFLSKNQNLKFLEIKFINSFLLSDYSRSKRLVKELENQKEVKEQIRICNKISYFKMLMFFVSNDYLRVTEHLLEFPSLFSSENSLSINVRIVEIYVLFILNRTDLCRYKLDSLRQAVMRKKNINKDRYLFIERLLNSLITHDKDIVFTLSKYNVQRSKYGAKDYKFIIDREGYELISIEDFLQIFEKNFIKEYASL